MKSTGSPPSSAKWSSSANGLAPEKRVSKMKGGKPTLWDSRHGGDNGSNGTVVEGRGVGRGYGSAAIFDKDRGQGGDLCGLVLVLGVLPSTR